MTDLKSNTLMGENLKKLQHHQWGTINGYANECIVAVLKDEIERLKKQLQPFDTEHINNTIVTLQYRIEGTTQDTSPSVQEHEMTWGTEYE